MTIESELNVTKQNNGIGSVLERVDIFISEINPDAQGSALLIQVKREVAKSGISQIIDWNGEQFIVSRDGYGTNLRKIE